MHAPRAFLLACGLLLAFAGVGWAQTPPLLVPPSASPAQPVAPPTLPPAETETPLPGAVDTDAFAGDPDADPEKSVILDNADTFEQTTPGKWTGEGHVRVRYLGYRLTGDRVDVDTDKGTAIFSGNVRLLAPNGQTADAGQGGVLRVNLRRGTYTLTGARSTIQPEQTPFGLILPVYVFGGVIHGQPGLIDARGGRFTTCDFLEPHYAFGAREVYIIPGRRLVGRDVSFYRKNHRLFSIPYFFAPLDQRLARQTLFPTVGQTPDEGYFIKFAFGYALAASLPGILRVDEFQKKGTGLGFDQTYGDPNRPARGSGVATLYRLFDRSRGVEDLNGTLTHSQQFGMITASLTTQFQQNSYYAGLSKSQSQNSSLGLTRAVGPLRTALLTTLTQNSFGLGRSQTLTSSLDNTYSPTDASQLAVRFDFSQYTSPSFSTFVPADKRQELDSTLDYKNRGRLVDFELLAAKYTQLSSSAGSSPFFGGLERLPELRFGTDALRFSGFSRFLPRDARMDLSLGEFHEPSSRTHTQRARFELNLGTTTKALSGRSSLDYGGDFEQGLYGDNTAQYVLNGHTGYRLRIGQKSTLNATYTYLRPYGYTPFQFDYAGSTNLAALSLAAQESRRFRLSVGTGYDFNRTHSRFGFRAMPWQTVSAQALYVPADFLRFRTTASYDLNNSRLLDLTNTLRIRGADNLALDFSGRFSPLLHRYTTLNGSLNLPFFRDPREDAGYRLRAIGGYDGITSRFNYKGLALTRSWHDFEASVIYQDTPNGLRPGSTVTFNFRLKAFPAYEPFATGQYGQSLDTGIGETL